MVKIIDIAIKNLKTIFRDKKGLLFLVLIPIFFYSLMGFVFGGMDNNGGDSYVYKVGFVDLDSSNSDDPYKNMTYIYGVLDKLESIEMYEYQTNESAAAALESKDIDAYIIIPQGYELYINGTGPLPSDNLIIMYRVSADTVTKSVISGTIIGVIDGIVNYNPASLELIYEEGSITGQIANQVTLGTPGYLMYGILSSLSGSVILITSEKKDGMLKRLESSRMNAKDMLGGHLISNTVIVSLQFVIGIVMLSLFGFNPFYSDLLSLILGVVITVLLLSFFQNALALVSGAIFKTPESAGGGVWLILIPLMTFSGAFFPLEWVAPALVPYVKWIPTRMVVLLFQDLMVNSVSLLEPSIWIGFAVIAVESIVLFLIAIKMYSKFARS